MQLDKVYSMLELMEKDILRNTSIEYPLVLMFAT